MLRKALCVLALGFALISPTQAGHPDIASMKAEFSKCMICKNLVSQMEMLFPVMTMEVVALNGGVALVHHVSDAAKVPVFHTMHDEMVKSGEAAMALTDEQAKTQMCGWCNQVRGLVQAGAMVSHGKTKDGDMMVFTSSDPATQAKIMAFGDETQKMVAGHDGQGHEG